VQRVRSPPQLLSRDFVFLLKYFSRAMWQGDATDAAGCGAAYATVMKASVTQGDTRAAACAVDQMLLASFSPTCVSASCRLYSSAESALTALSPYDMHGAAGLLY